MTVHHRRPVPVRTDTIGPWLDTLTFLTWLGALTNAALVYLFSPQLLSGPASLLHFGNATESFVSHANDTTTIVEEHMVAAAGGLKPPSWGIDGSASASTLSATAELLLKAALVALLASHGYMLLRVGIRHVVDRVCWRASKEVEELEREVVKAREGELKGTAGAGSKLGAEKVIIEREVLNSGGEGREENENGERKDDMGFWDHDEGIEEIRRISKEA